MFFSFKSCMWQAQRGKLYIGYIASVKWFFALLIGVGKEKFDLTNLQTGSTIVSS